MLWLSQGGYPEKFYALKVAKHLDFKVELTKILVDKTRVDIGASPNKVMKRACEVRSVVEIECPHKIWDKTKKDNFK